MSGTKEPRRVQSVSKAVALLREFAEAETLSLSELAERISENPSTVHHIAQTLAAEHFLTQDSVTKRYMLGPALLSLASPETFRATQARLLSEPLLAAARATGFDVWAGYLRNDRVHYFVHVAAGDPIRDDLPSPQPVYCTSAGRVLLAALRNDQVIKVLNQTRLQKYTKFTVTDPQVILREVERTRREGYSDVVDEYFLGIRNISVPVLGHGGLVIASLTIGASSNVIVDENIEFLLAHLKDAAIAASIALGVNIP